MDVLLVLVAVSVGVLIGWLAARQRADTTLRGAYADIAGLRATLDSERDGAQQREALLLRTDTQLGELFGAQAAEALHRNSAAVAERADGSLAPLRDSLEHVRRELAELQRGRASSDTALREQVQAMNDASARMRDEAATLVTALRAPQVRGRWGEMQLERVVEAAGMTEHVDFVTQASVSGPDGTQRPDLVVLLTGGRRVVVDAKIAFAAYLEAAQAEHESVRDERLRAHARQLRHHIDALAAKSYWQRFTPTPEFVVCFVPADPILDAALRADPGLLEHAFTHDIVLATPSTLVALLRTIAYGWRQEALAANAEQVLSLGSELYRRLGTLGNHVGKLGKSLGNAVDAYNEAVGSLEQRVFSTARKMNDLGVVAPDASLPGIEPLTEVTPRPLLAPEWDDPRVVTLHRSAQSTADGRRL
jgi:DNA recombination protein RmuC